MTLAQLLAERAKIEAQLKEAAIKELQVTRVNNRNMFKRETLKNIIKGNSK